MLELDRARRIEVALIERALTFGRLDPAKVFASRRHRSPGSCSTTAERHFGKAGRNTRRRYVAAAARRGTAHRTAEGVRRALPSLLKLRRSQARAVAKRDQAIRKLLTIPAERTQFRLE